MLVAHANFGHTALSYLMFLERVVDIEAWQALNAALPPPSPLVAAVLPSLVGAQPSPNVENPAPPMASQLSLPEQAALEALLVLSMASGDEIRGAAPHCGFHVAISFSGTSKFIEIDLGSPSKPTALPKAAANSANRLTEPPTVVVD